MLCSSCDIVYTEDELFFTKTHVTIIADLVLVAVPHLVVVVLDALVVADDGRVGDVGLGRAAGGGGGRAVPGARPRPLGVSLGPEARDRDITVCWFFAINSCLVEAIEEVQGPSKR